MGCGVVERHLEMAQPKKTLVSYAVPWAWSLHLGNDKLFIGPKHSIYTFLIFLFGLLDLILLYVCQICHVNYETEN